MEAASVTAWTAPAESSAAVSEAPGWQFGRPSVIRSRKLCRWMVDPKPEFAATKARLSPVGVPPPTPPASGEAVAPTRLMAKSTAFAPSRSAESSSEVGRATSMALAGVQKLLVFPLPGSVIVASGGTLTVYSNGTQLRIGTDVRFSGLIVAPNATVNVFSRTNIAGCVGGRDVTLDTDVTLNGGALRLPVQ